MNLGRAATGRWLFLCILATAGCRGPQYHFDPAPRPPWIDRAGASGQDLMSSIGRSPVTVTPQRDLELATVDAQRQIGLRFESEVKSSSSDWSLAIDGPAGAKQLSLIDSSVIVKSNVKIEAWKVAASYRDELTRTQYVEVLVDVPAWLKQVSTRVAQQSASLERKIVAAEEALGARRPLAALRETRRAYEEAALGERDVIVLALLASDTTPREAFGAQKARLDVLARKIGGGHCVRASITGGTGADALRKSLAQFLGEQSLESADGGCGDGTIRVEGGVGERALRTERVANRVEHLHAAIGELRVFEPNGEAFAALAVHLPGDAHIARHVDPARASEEASSLAGATLAQKFRAAFRKLVLAR